MTYRIVTTATMATHESVLEGLVAAGCQIDRLPEGATIWTPDLIAQFAPTADAYVGTFRGVGLPRAVLEASPRVRVVTSPIIGVDHIDVGAATEQGVLVAHGAMPENFEGMAEAGVMLIAALRKALPQKLASMREGFWKAAPAGHLTAGSTIGLLGFGRIGRGVAQRLAGWNCEILAHDPYVDATKAAAHGATLTTFDELLSRSDVLLVLVTLTPETRHIIDAQALAKMKPGACLINIGRGGCVDEQALIQALDTGHISGAAIDTWEQEPPVADHPLRDHPHVIATSHDVGHSTELYDSIPRTAVANTLAALRGQVPGFVRNPEALPRWRERIEAQKAAWWGGEFTASKGARRTK